MNEAAMILLRHKDFTSFSKHHTQNKTNICHVTKAVWHKSGNHEYRFTITSDRFLRGMVRAIVGTLVLVGRNKLSLSAFEEIIRERDRAKAGANAPANALFLTGIKYPSKIHL
jgi:tRNA pseudouridine38-40 synthase